MKIFTKSYYSIFAVFFVVLLGGLITSCFYDLEVNIAVTNFDSKFGMICASFGQLPGWCMMGFFGVMAFKLSQQVERKLFKVLLIIFAVLVVGVSGYLIFGDMNSSHNGFKEISKLWVRILIAVILEAIIVFIGYKVIDTKDTKTLLRTWIILMIAYYLGLAIVFIMKEIWTRPRYRLIYNGYEGYTVYDLFKRWYEPGRGIAGEIYPYEIVHSDDFKSFPSGHSYDSMTCILLSYIPLLNTKQKDKPWIRSLILGITGCYAMMIAFSRILYGAHYLSDVTFGGLVGVICAFVVPYFGFKIVNKKENVKNC